MMSFERNFATLKSFFRTDFFVTKFKLKVSIFISCLIFVWIRGVQPDSEFEELPEFCSFSYQFFDRLRQKLWKKLNCSPDTMLGLDAPSLDCER